MNNTNSTDTPEDTLTDSVVYLIGSRAKILRELSNNTDEPITQRGLSSMDAMIRHQTSGAPYLVVPWADTESSAVNFNYFGVALNLALNLLYDWKFYVAHPSLIQQQATKQEVFHLDDFDIERSTGVYDLQWESFPLLLTNVAVPPSNSWNPFVKGVFFDDETNLAVMYMAPEQRDNAQSQIDAARSMLFYVAKVNTNNLCGPLGDTTLPYWFNLTQPTKNCYAPVIFYDDTTSSLSSFLDGMQEAETPFPPALVVYPNGIVPGYEDPTPINILHDNSTLMAQTMWVVSYNLSPESYHQQRIELGFNGTIVDVQLLSTDLSELPPEAMDSQYNISEEVLGAFLYFALEENVDKDVGKTGAMPAVSSVDGTRNRCYAGECEIGNLFTDALLHAGENLADVAFLPSFLFGGDGWPAGEVTIKDLWDAFPFLSNVCYGTMTGLSLFKLLDFSISQATFTDKITAAGGNLLQVAGMKIQYDLTLPTSRIYSIEIWDIDSGVFQPIERLKLYNFTTDASVCSSYDQFVKFVGDDLVLEGEIAGIEQNFETVQEITRYYLSALDKAYDTSLDGRLQEVQLVSSPGQGLNLIQTQSDCVKGSSYWKKDVLSCLPCPAYDRVAFQNRTMELDGTSHTARILKGEIVLVNEEAFEVRVDPRASSFPSWISVNKSSIARFAPGTRTPLQVAVNTEKLEAGTALATIAFTLADSGTHPGCAGEDLLLEVFTRVSPERQLNQLGPVAVFGFVVFGLVFLTAGFFAGWVQCHKKERVVTAMQPVFLTVLCFGVVVLGSTAVSLSIDDGLMSDEDCSRACMSIPWLVSNGFTITTAALFSKLWRINKLFGQGQFRRIQVREKDVLAPFAVLFVLNLIMLFVWTFVDPLTWTRNPVMNQPWNSYGSCSYGSGSVAIAMTAVIFFLNFVGFVGVCVQAFRARNISSEFSESKYLGIAIFSWAQLLIVGLPVYFLINDDNPTAKYSLVVALILAVCMSMLLVIFVPMLIVKSKGVARQNVHISGVSDATSTGAPKISTQSNPGYVASGAPKISGLSASSEISPHSNGASGVQNQSTAISANSFHEQDEKEKAVESTRQAELEVPSGEDDGAVSGSGPDAASQLSSGKASTQA